ncbi:cell division control protein Cdc6 [Candidatus Woesearchaeota archaeon]|nr:cell division control protein Cdc6 [Candidatus Woesearchaeota archaeon]
MQQELVNFLEGFASKKSIFVNKKVFQPSYKPTTILHRNDIIEQTAKILAPVLKLEKPSNLFIYGKTGTGKTLSIKDVTDGFSKLAASKNIPLKIIYINCKLKRVSDTEYRLIAQLSREFGKTIPATGLPTDEIYKIFFNVVEESEKAVILVLDEIDQLTKKTGSEVLYNLTRINEDLSKSFISLIGISNDLNFVDTLDPRVKSSLSEEELLFPPYNAFQIQDILTERSDLGFAKNTLDSGVIPKCAAYAAREHGDARRALELLRIAGELANRSSSKKVATRHVDEAEEKIDRDRILDAIRTQPKQAQAALFSIISTSVGKQNPIFTGAVYEFYKEICTKTGLRPLTQRRLSDIISELDMLGIITARVISKGRYGRTREIVAPKTLQTDAVRKILKDAINL